MVRVGSIVIIKTVGGSPGGVAIIILAIFTIMSSSPLSTDMVG